MRTLPKAPLWMAQWIRSKAPNRPARSKSRQRPDAGEGASENGRAPLELYPPPAEQNQYALDLLKSEAAKIRSAPDGQQEKLLNDCSFKVGGAVGAGCRFLIFWSPPNCFFSFALWA